MPQINLDAILRAGVIAVVRASDSGVLPDVAEALVSGGVDVVEITFTVPSADRVIEQLAGRMGGRAIVGAGTVLDAETARVAILAGAKFVVSPIMGLPVIELCRRYGVPVMAGAFTPTEVVAAWQAGADVVKVFPSEIAGPAYLAALRGPLPQVRLMPTGGVSLENAADYIRAGACALGVGGSLVDSAAIGNRDFDRITRRAREFVAVVARARGDVERNSFRS